MIADLHIHSKFSYDSLLSPEKILKVSKKRGLDVIAITDHETIRGGLEVQKMNSDEDFFVIVGCEINTEIGDIIGLFVNEEINSKIFIEVVEEIKIQGGLVILPHPFRGHRLENSVIQYIDAVEIFNSRSTIEQNAKALLLAKEWKKPITAGSDAHFASEIGLGSVNIVNFSNDNDLISEFDEKSVIGSLNPWYLTYLSQMIKSGKSKNFSLFARQFINLVGQVPRFIKK